MPEFQHTLATNMKHRIKVKEVAAKANDALAMQETRFHDNEENVCPSCKGTAWLIGRTTAECANEECQLPMERLSQMSRGSGTITHKNLHIPMASRGNAVINSQF